MPVPTRPSVAGTMGTAAGSTCLLWVTVFTPTPQSPQFSFTPLGTRKYCHVDTSIQEPREGLNFPLVPFYPPGVQGNCSALGTGDLGPVPSCAIQPETFGPTVFFYQTMHRPGCRGPWHPSVSALTFPISLSEKGLTSTVLFPAMPSVILH